MYISSVSNLYISTYVCICMAEVSQEVLARQAIQVRLDRILSSEKYMNITIIENQIRPEIDSRGLTLTSFYRLRKYFRDAFLPYFKNDPHEQ